MIEDGAPRLVEFNVRLGDPEAQALMMRLGGQALDLIQACAEGRLGGMRVQWADDHALTVVVAAQGYPGAVERGAPVGGLDAVAESSRGVVFHAGTAERDGRVVASGGRVLAVTARGDTLREARDRAYAMVERIDLPGAQVRRDIGWRALGEA
jgi:phosphoribosylamine--glycine ligase